MALFKPQNECIELKSNDEFSISFSMMIHRCPKCKKCIIINTDIELRNQLCNQSQEVIYVFYFTKVIQLRQAPISK